MCEPVSATAGASTFMGMTAAQWGAASAIMTLAGTGMSAMGQMQQGQAAKAQGDYQAAVARNNSILAERQAADAEARGAEAERQQRIKTQLVLGKQTSALAASGVQLDEGSSGLDILGDTAQYGELDALTVRTNAAREAWSYRAQGGNYEAQARLNELQGSSGQMAGMVGAGASLLTGAGSVADKWLTYKYGKTRVA
jgi:hypothetical protein